MEDAPLVNSAVAASSSEAPKQAGSRDFPPISAAAGPLAIAAAVPLPAASAVPLSSGRTAAADARRLGISKHAIAVGNGRDPARFRPDPAARAGIRAGLGVPDDRVVVVAISRLVRHKGYPELAAAMRDVPDAELWVVGERLETDRGEDMVAVLRAAGLGHRLRLLGYRTDIPAILAAADIFTPYAN